MEAKATCCCLRRAARGLALFRKPLAFHQRRLAGCVWQAGVCGVRDDGGCASKEFGARVRRLLRRCRLGVDCSGSSGKGTLRLAGCEWQTGDRVLAGRWRPGVRVERCLREQGRRRCREEMSCGEAEASALPQALWRMLAVVPSCEGGASRRHRRTVGGPKGLLKELRSVREHWARP